MADGQEWIDPETTRLLEQALGNLGLSYGTVEITVADGRAHHVRITRTMLTQHERTSPSGSSSPPGVDKPST